MNVESFKFAATFLPSEGGVIGSNLPANTKVGILLITGSFSILDDEVAPQNSHILMCSFA